METNVLFALLMITGLAFVIPILTKRLDRFGIPIVVYEIIAGMIIGISGFNLIEPSAILTFLAEFGFAFLMFLSGLELDLRLLNPARSSADGEHRLTQALPLGILIFLGTILLAFAATTLFALSGSTSNPMLLGLILSTTSLGVVVPVLKERELTSTRFGQYILVAASIADFATLLLLTTVIAVLSRGLTLDLLLIPILLLIFMMVARFSHLASKGQPAPAGAEKPFKRYLTNTRSRRDRPHGRLGGPCRSLRCRVDPRGLPGGRDCRSVIRT